MTQPVLKTTVQKLEIENVGSIAVTDIVQDTDGNSVREIRVSGVADTDNSSAPIVFTLRLSSDVATKIALTTPSLSF